MFNRVQNTNINFDPSVESLFPNNPEASQDKKCVIIAEVIQQLISRCDMSGTTQDNLRADANKRYEFLSKEDRLALPQADHAAFLLYQKGVNLSLVQKYYSIRLSDEDAKKWVIRIK